MTVASEVTENFEVMGSSRASDGFRRPYWKVFFNVAIVWWVIAGLVTVAAWTVAPNPLFGLDLLGVLGVSLGSGLVAAMAILPGMVVTVPSTRPTTVDVDPGLQPDPEPSGDLSQSAAVERLGQAFLAGMLIRLAGTVALFMASSYYLRPSDAGSVLASIAGNPNATGIAAWVLVWHAILLLAEVVSLAREIKRREIKPREIKQSI